MKNSLVISHQSLVISLGLTHRGSETGFFYEKTQVVTPRLSKKPGFFGMCASTTVVIKINNEG
jgi:hypothetical protein